MVVVTQEKCVLGTQLTKAEEACGKKEVELENVAHMLKEVVEADFEIQVMLDIRTQQVY